MILPKTKRYSLMWFIQNETFQSNVYQSKQMCTKCGIVQWVTSYIKVSCILINLTELKSCKMVSILSTGTYYGIFWLKNQSHERGQNCTERWEVHCQYQHFNTTISKVRPIFKFLVYFGLIFSKTFGSMPQLIFLIHRIDLLEFWKLFEYFCRHLNRLLTNLKPHSNCYWPNLGTL